MQDYLTVCERAARAGGRVLLDWQGRIHAKEKAPKDLVTEADLASQRTIQAILQETFPDHDFLGEEEDNQQIAAERRSEFRWIVDPLDGTANYVHQLQTFAVSIALEQRGDVLVGVIYDPVLDQCFSACRGGGAFMNGQRLHVSRRQRLASALVAASLPANVQRNSAEIKRLVEVLVECQALRRLGSAALNLAYLASGRLDGYWATNVKIWDVAAGILLVREAGGIVTGLDGGAFDLARPRFAAAATRGLHTELLSALGRGANRP